MAEPYHQRGRRLLQVLAATVAVALAAAYPAFLIFFGHWFGHWARTHSSEAILLRPWVILALVVSGTALLVMLTELFVLVLPLAQGLVNERLGRSARAAECYQNALSRYLRGGYFPFRTSSRLMGTGLFSWKNEALDLTVDEAFEFVKDMRDACNQMRKGIVSGRLLPLFSFFQGFNDFIATIETAESMVDLADTLRAGQLARLEKRAAKTVKSDLGNLDRGLTLYYLGKYEDARALFDGAANGLEASEDTDLKELASLFGALAAWEIGDRADCGLRMRGLRPADLDVHLHVITLRCLLASAQGKPQKAAATLERIASRVRDSSVDADALAWLTYVRATALRTLGRYDDALQYAQQAVEHFQPAGPAMALDARLEVARALTGLGRHDDAIAVAASATAEMDVCRYELGATDNRSAFARANGSARALALELAAAGAPRLAAELIECGRVQGLPAIQQDHDVAHAGAPSFRKPRAKLWGRRSSSQPPAAENSSKSAAWTAVGLAPLTPPPRLDLFVPGDSELVRIAPQLPVTDQVVLAQVAEAVAGKEWWWWGSWVAGDQLYWSLIGHDGTVEAGAIPMASLEPVLARLLATLPTPLEGDTGGNVARARSGALAQPGPALQLTSELGKLLIPPTLRHLTLAGAASGQPVSLVIAPAPALGRVPFGLLGLAKTGTQLAHGAVVRLGASVALLEQVRRRHPGQLDGDVLGVIDPCGREVAEPSGKRAKLSLVADNHLGKMGISGWAWLQDRPVLSRFGHLAELGAVTDLARQATISELSKALRTTAAGTLAYIGHVSNAPDDVPANTSLVLDDDNLYARDLLYDDKRRWPMPPRVALLGCGSGGAQAPEWLGLAPASMWAGAEIVAATAWDLIDEPDTWNLAEEVVTILHGGPDPAAEWRKRFIGHLEDWKSDRDAPSPLSWAAIQFIGLVARSDQAVS
jgi:tetratricopeptide (TPR) repeat protein